MKWPDLQTHYSNLSLKSNVRLNPFGTKIAQSVRLKWVFDLSSKIDLFSNHKNRSKIVVFCLFPMFLNTIFRKFRQSVRLKWVSDLSSKNGLFQKAWCST